MSSSSRSLLDFIDAPVVVGDPDGRAVYVNPAFQQKFDVVVTGDGPVPPLAFRAIGTAPGSEEPS